MMNDGWRKIRRTGWWVMKAVYNCHGGGRSVAVVVAVVIIVMAREGKRREGQEEKNTVDQANMVDRVSVAIVKETEVVEEAERVTVVVTLCFVMNGNGEGDEQWAKGKENATG